MKRSDVIDNANIKAGDVIVGLENLVQATYKKALAYCNHVKPLFEDIRYHCDKLELLVDDEIWPLTKYRELLFTR